MSSAILDYKNIIRIIGLIILAIAFSWFGEILNLPIPYLLIPLFLGVLVVVIEKKPQPLPKLFSIIGQAIIAIVTASRFSVETFTQAQDFFFPLLFCILITATLSLINGYIIYKWANIDLATSFLGCIPGAGPSLVAMSEDMGADAIAVAVLQYLRILMVSVIIPIIASFYSNQTSTSPIIVTTNQQLLPSLPLIVNIILISIFVFISIKIGEKIQLPSNLFLAPFFCGLLIFSFSPYEIDIPSYIFRGGLLLLGLSIGVKFEVETIQKLLKAVLIEVGLVLLLIFTCFLAGYGFHLMTKIDTLTALLGSTPGGLTAMMATVIELGGDSALVLTMQMMRMLLILTLSPFFAASLMKKSSETTQN
ncbi:AbrB family transcriptional regulator [Cyanobacterium sp. Dongsha4]|uniref:AbrB family transcriptional regulator n=1 Tax=Cyanobacterium sp. DS4 TaxID=2878255 RepID=UPI002E8171ED|nr:AbrB family transcriptional regulator [Cyanobacterium sp. Dongsha4]WVL01716.1 AbrB family transcriptional regulator [Cyanobacterium sp. Dongsha4]